MPKVKTHKGLAKRVRVTGTGKVKHKKSGRSHLNSGMSGDEKRKKAQPKMAHSTVARKLKNAMHRPLQGG